jgi:hypothetical protein
MNMSAGAPACSRMETQRAARLANSRLPRSRISLIAAPGWYHKRSRSRRLVIKAQDIKSGGNL